MKGAVSKKVIFENLGLIDYQKAWNYQESLFDKVVSAKQNNKTTEAKKPAPNYLLFCEHPHVYTLGKSGKESNLLMNEDFLKSKGATFYRINRGGDITYHGPGQIVGYPIIDLDNFGLSIRTYIDDLEEVVIRCLKFFGIEAMRFPGATGVWLDVDNSAKARKICAIGVRTSHWVSMHGFAFNVSTNLEYFNYIVPCGIVGKGVTTLEKELGKQVEMEEVKRVLLGEFKEVFGMEM
jgi:lipoyl(octanoyl) transferase